jgi:hypothetical protein
VLLQGRFLPDAQQKVDPEIPTVTKPSKTAGKFSA